MLDFIAKKTQFLLLMCLSLLALSSISMASGNNDADVKPKWAIEVQDSGENILAEPGIAKLIVFRMSKPNDSYIKKPLNIFIDGQYHASLVSEAKASVISLCSNVENITFSLGSKKENISQETLNHSEISLRLKPGTLSFYQVAINDDGSVIGRWIDDQDSIGAIKTLPLQIHTISRLDLNRSCPDEVFNIAASTLFKFGRYDINGLTEKGKDELANIAAAIKNNYQTIDKVVVNGYADLIGSPDYNTNLSLKRAEGVAMRLKALGLSSGLIQVQGLGQNNLIVTDCSDRYQNRNEIILCNEPNRRVEVEVYGIPKINN